MGEAIRHRNIRLRTKLVLTATGSTLVLVLVLGTLFLGELLRQRIGQTATSNDVTARQIAILVRGAVQSGLRLHPPDPALGEAGFQQAVTEALRDNEALNDALDAAVRYSPAVQDVSVGNTHGVTLLSTDPTMEGRPLVGRMNFEQVKGGGVVYQARVVFGWPGVLDITAPLARNSQPFLVVHVGVRSTFLRESYAPWLWDAFWFALIAGVSSVLVAAVLASLALRPLEEISRRLEQLMQGEEPTAERKGGDAMVRVTREIDLLGQRMRSTEAGYTDLQANLNQMLDRLRDGVVLFGADGRAAMVSDAVEPFSISGQAGPAALGKTAGELFGEDTALGQDVLRALQDQPAASSGRTLLSDGREVEWTLDRVERGRMGVMLTLRDVSGAESLERELEVSRRLAAVGRLTAGVGHEVKNPINAIVVHLELLRNKLSGGDGHAPRSAMRHVEVLSGEMARLDRVVQTLTDFTRPMELRLEEMELIEVVRAVVELTSEELAEHGVACAVEEEAPGILVRADGEQLRQALLNLLLNGVQAMEERGGGRLVIRLKRRGGIAVLEVEDQGVGIPAEILPRIFDLYFTTKPKGSGIGLAMTYRIVQMHGGSLEVESQPGQGSCFQMRLPALATDREGSRRSHAGRLA